jgi:oxygen-independent coproporphyrinogen-3 oxidase
MQLDVLKDNAQTEVGSYFVANYPPFSAWRPEGIGAAQSALHAPAESNSPVGLYIHIPFCRKRCKFCYFRVYTDKNAHEVDVYCDALVREIALYARLEALAGRDFEFVYFGGGTPSFLSSVQLETLIKRIAEHWTWERAREVTFECEPGTLKKSKLQTIKSIGVTRLSLGIEHCDDEVLALNGRAHKSPEVFRSYDWAREVGFSQINVVLIAGMLGDTTDKWQDMVEQTLALDPDSVTIYQMELPHNTVIARESGGGTDQPPVADWPTKRAWVDHAFERFEAAGYEVSSAYTLVKPSDDAHFVYRDALWHGADMIGTGVASFSHFAGVHFQNHDHWDEYIAAVDQDQLPVSRALQMTPQQQLTRELVLQSKLGRIDAGYFREKFGVHITRDYAEVYGALSAQGLLTVDGDTITLTRRGLLCVDALLPYFFEPQFRSFRYT